MKNTGQPLWNYNQLMRSEQRQVLKSPADKTEARYFMYGMAIYDIRDFTKVVGIDWTTDGDGVIKVKVLEPGWVLVERV